MPSLSTLQTWLTEAYSVRHQIAMGAQLVNGSRDGRAFAYTPTNIDVLNAYILQLETDIAAGGTPATPAKRIFRIKQTGQGY